jgi:hypothetical protein
MREEKGLKMGGKYNVRGKLYITTLILEIRVSNEAIDTGSTSSAVFRDDQNFKSRGGGFVSTARSRP